MSGLSGLASHLAGLRERVGPRPYVTWGLALAGAKFLLDTGIVYAFTGRMWSPLGYLVPSQVLRQDAVGAAPQTMHVLLPLVALPFLWIGLSMSIRRAADAGISPWIGTLFVVPLVNYGVIAVLSFLPSRPAAGWTPPESSAYRQPAAPPSSSDAAIPSGIPAALGGVLAGMGIGVAMLWVCVYGLGVYGVTLFFVTPFAMGMASAAIYNRRAVRSLGATLGVAAVAVLLAGSAMLLFAIEGALCLAMAGPIVITVALIGAAVARAIVLATRRSGMAGPAMMLALPGVALGELRVAHPALHSVTTDIEVDAPPERVWPHVVGFSDLEDPPDWFFRLGIAYPKRARIDGSGVGAIRRCEFSTGAFVEPITEWAPPAKLAFDVTAQPPSMAEWSPYGSIRAPHLEGYMVSRGGEFDLTRLPGNRTRLEGTTRYTLSFYPDVYWRPFAEAILHAIHGRVLVHIKALSEAR